MKVFKCLFIATLLVIITINAYAISGKEGGFLLITGPSGSGKSTIISYLKQIDPRFVYVTPYTTRKLRRGEHDKLSISVKQMKKLEKDKKLLVVNKIYGIYYGTPKTIIDDAINQGNFPVLDWPIEKIDIMKKHYNNNIYVVYVLPENIKELKNRLTKDKRDKDGQRLSLGIKELKNNLQGLYDNNIDLKIINKKHEEKKIAEIIYDKFINNEKVDYQSRKSQV
jgi:guanylate kinase